MWFKTNPVKKAQFDAIRATEKELAKKNKLLRRMMKRFMVEPDPKRAEELAKRCSALTHDIVIDKRIVDGMIDRYNRTWS